MGFNLPVLNRRRRLLGTAVFSPTALFALSEPGVWYDPSDLTTMFQDRAGTTPVTAPGQSVGLRLDKSKGLVLGPELVAGALSGPTNWTLDATGSVTGGALVINTPISTSSIQIYTPPVAGTFVVGRRYAVTFTVAWTRGLLNCIVGSAGTSFSISSSGTFTAYLECAGGTPNRISFSSAASTINNFIGSITALTVRELPGNHAVANSDTARGIYGIEPLGGRRNLLTYTEQFDNAAWGKTAVTATGTEVRETTADSAHVISQNVSLTGTHAFSLELQAVGRDVYTIWMGTTSATFAFTYTFSTNVISAVGTALSNVTAIVLSGGWVRFTGSVVTPNRFQVSVGTPNTTYVGDPAAGFNIRNAQLETGSTATAYQKVVSQYEVTEAGKPTLHYVQYDGVDDGYVTPTITPGTDKVQVFAGVRRFDNTGYDVVAETSTSFDANNGAITIGNTANWISGSKGTIAATASFAVTAPVTSVLTGLSDISADRATLRVNGAQVAQSTSDQGTGNYLAYPLYIGRRGGTSLPFNGRDYGLIVRFGANLDASTISATETWLNSKTGAY